MQLRHPCSVTGSRPASRSSTGTWPIRDLPGVLADVERVTDSPARSFVQWALDHAGDFR